MSAMRTAVISLLVPLVRGSCLPDAIQPGQRQNLVNLNGETYPVGFMVGSWAASYAAHILAATLVEEILGYNTTTTIGADVASGSVAGYYGIAGCRTFNDIADRGCMKGVTYYHVGLETWMGYPTDWDYIQNTYTSMAPKNLGSMGYAGVSGHWIPNEVQSHAYSTQGKALEFYRSWNASWNQPSNFFSSVLSIDRSKMALCNASGGVLANDAIMRRHVRWTGDIDGVVINNDTDVYSGRCDDGVWWAAPSCRNDLTKCVPFIGAGAWGVEHAMQKFAAHNMPAAVGVPASWSSYMELPLLANLSFYWWAPDPTFLELSPLYVEFPPYDAKGWKEGNLQTGEDAAPVNSIVSADLAVLAPFVEAFVDKLELPIAEMNKMLLDQKNTGDTWRNVTCRWVTANRAIWQKWIPDESECFPGFGLYDHVLQGFTDSRVNATNKVVCQACPPGMFSQKLEDNKGVTYVCVACGKGTSQSSGASLACAPCKTGEYQDELQSTECKRCDFGTYQDQTGQEACKACPASTRTLGFGSVAATDCGCPEKYIDIDRSGAFECVKCSEGMKCPALSQLDDLENGISTNGEQFTPKIMQGYYSTITSPTEVFLCTSATNCPGGPPGTCAGGLVDIPCSQCAEGMTWTGSLCEDCAGWRQALWVPRWSATRQDHLVAAVRFLVFRFRLDSWWFGVPLLVRGPLINLPVVLATDFPPIQIVCIAMILTTMMVMQMLAWPWKVPLLNATDCIISFCVVLLVTTSTLYLNEIDETMYGFASAVSTVMLSSIGGAIGIMFLMTGSALFYRSAMGGKKELKFFNLGSVPQSDDLAKKVKEMVGELEAMEVAELSKKLNALAVFDISKLTTCITLLATEVAPPAQDAYSFKFNKRIASSSFDPALKRKQQTLRQSHSKEETKVGEADNALVESDETTQQSWM